MKIAPSDRMTLFIISADRPPALHFVVSLSAVQTFEVGDPIDTEQHGFPVDNEPAGAYTESGLGDQRISAAPVVAVAGEQADAIGVPMHDYSEAVLFDFVQVSIMARHFGAAGRDAWEERSFTHAGQIAQRHPKLRMSEH